MRTSCVPVVIAGLAILNLTACDDEAGNSAIANGVGALGSLARICPSAVKVDPALQPQRISFDPYVENRGVNPSTKPFTVSMTVARAKSNSGSQTLIFSSPNEAIIGTEGVAGRTAGPPTKLSTTNTLATRSMAYDPTDTYTVDLYLNSNDENFNIASQDCQHLGPLKFRGGQPI